MAKECLMDIIRDKQFSSSQGSDNWKESTWGSMPKLYLLSMGKIHSLYEDYWLKDNILEAQAQR